MCSFLNFIEQFLDFDVWDIPYIKLYLILNMFFSLSHEISLLYTFFIRFKYKV
jgi:hypothetical protein